MKEELLHKITKLRLAVGYMIEKQEWWSSTFFSTHANDYLGYIFPKSTKENAGFFLDSIKYSVDAEVGANYYHLFRLPIELEEQLHKITFDIKESVYNDEKALHILEQLSDGLTVEANNGPINIGNSDQLNSDIVQAFATQYYFAFLNHHKVHPYLN